MNQLAVMTEIQSATLEVRAATPSDMHGVVRLVNNFAARGLMLPRVPEQIVRHFREFVVITDEGGETLGCGCLRVYTPQLAEVGALAVAEEAQGMGVGRLLVTAIEQQARDLGIGTVFALTLQDGFFHRLGYDTVPKELFPDKVWADCRTCATRDECVEIAVMKEL